MAASITTVEADDILAFALSVASEFDRSPVTKDEWDWASGDEFHGTKIVPAQAR